LHRNTLDFDKVLWLTEKYNTLEPSRYTRECSVALLGYYRPWGAQTHVAMLFPPVSAVL